MSIPTIHRKYIEPICSLLDKKSYVSLSDIVNELEIYPSLATKIVKEMQKENYLVYSRNEGLIYSNQFHFNIR
ncbi:hypothetical protein [Bacillus sp. EB600]|uniref:hypothetical protein n=1 Tax=Bacillus sp. EB600 TaxID=2806345 RepID=UPI00210CE545|nr:hypothetical protein [Bacillus sp. EB600]MCQ6282935.1 hypothetical protein [Bacillus sp. EB600]